MIVVLSKIDREEVEGKTKNLSSPHRGNACRINSVEQSTAVHWIETSESILLMVCFLLDVADLHIAL